MVKGYHPASGKPVSCHASGFEVATRHTKLVTLLSVFQEIQWPQVAARIAWMRSPGGRHMRPTSVLSPCMSLLQGANTEPACCAHMHRGTSHCVNAVRCDSERFSAAACMCSPTASVHACECQHTQHHLQQNTAPLHTSGAGPQDDAQLHTTQPTPDHCAATCMPDIRGRHACAALSPVRHTKWHMQCTSTPSAAGSVTRGACSAVLDTALSTNICCLLTATKQQPCYCTHNPRACILH